MQDIFRLMNDIRQQDPLGSTDGIDPIDKPTNQGHAFTSYIGNAISKLDNANTKTVEGSKKRKLSPSCGRTDSDSDVSDVAVEARHIKLARKSHKNRGSFRFKFLSLPNLIYPQSAYEGHHKTLPVSSERHLLQEFLVGRFKTLTTTSKGAKSIILGHSCLWA